MNKLKIVAAMIVMFVNTSQALEDSVVVIVNDRVVLQSELNERMKEIKTENLSRLQACEIKK